jgi:hypothetical protein
MLSSLLLAVGAPRAEALTEADELARFGSEGSQAGQLRFPAGSAADPITGHLFVVSGGQHSRVDEFTPWGEFVKAFGWDVAPGAVNEVQEVRVRAGTGDFRLGFGADTTADLPFDVEAADMEAALNGLPSIGGAGGSVAVADLPGNTATASPYVFLVTFKGSLAGSDLGQLVASNGTNPLAAGNPTTTLEVRTRADGTSGGSGFEHCTAESGCQEGNPGAGKGQFGSASEALTDSSGNIYVGEYTNGRVQKFSPSGRFILMIGGQVDKTAVQKREEQEANLEPVTVTPAQENRCTEASGDQCGPGVAGTGPGQFASFRTPLLSIAPSGEIVVASGNRIQRFNVSGEFQSEISIPGETIANLAVNPKTGDLYVDYASGVIEKATKEDVRILDPSTGTETDSIKVRNPLGLSFNPAGHLFVVEERITGGTNVPPHPEWIFEFDQENKQVSRFAEVEPYPGGDGSPMDRYRLAGVGINALGAVYVSNHMSSEDRGAFIRVFGPAPVSLEPPPRRAPEIKAQYATSVESGSAEVGAKINPRFWSDATFQVEYGTSPCNLGGCTVTPTSKLTSKVIDAPLATPGVFLDGLTPGTTYYYRFGTESTGGGPVFGTDPDGEGSETPTFLNGKERSFTTSRDPVSGVCPQNEAFRDGPAAALPDCRGYEMVSPVNKENGDIIALGSFATGLPATVNQSSIDGEKLAYGSYRAFGGDVDSAPYTSHYVAARGPDGWESHPISPPQGKGIVLTPNNLESGFKSFSSDLCHGWLEAFADPPLTVAAPEGYSNLYRRTDSECGGPTYQELNDVVPTAPGISTFRVQLQGVAADEGVAVFGASAPLTAEGTAEQNQLYASSDGSPHFVCVLPSGVMHKESCRAGEAPSPVSGDGSRVFWTASGSGDGRIYLRENPEQEQSAFVNGSATGLGKLTEGSKAVSSLFAAVGKAAFTSGSPTVTLLETSVGKFIPGQPVTSSGKIPIGTTIVSISGSTLTLSANATVTNSSAAITSAGPQPFAVGQAISGEGIPSATTITAVGAGSLTLSAAATITKANVPLTASSACSEPSKACTFAVSRTAEDQAGSVASRYLAAAEDGSRAIFSTQAGGGADLYEYRVADKSTQLIAKKVNGFLGASRDATRIYFASQEVLAPVNAEGKAPAPGKANLYFHENGQFSFIGTLEGEDLDSRYSPISSQSRFHTSRVSADGLHAAFKSAATLSGFDNTDAVTDKPDGEVYRYDAGADGGAGSLICASCDPSGARPRGNSAQEEPSAAWIPVPANDLYASRVLAEDGSRLFFNSASPLSPRDTNGREDVYQWEEVGSGDCDEDSSGYSASNGGCVHLMSSGKSPRDSTFVDASPTGNDVFFATLSSLVQQDYGLVDIYDARVGGGFAPPAQPPAACEGEACQSAPEAPNDPTPSSSSFEGAGNVLETVSRPVACPKGKVRRHGKCATKKPKRAHKRGARRAKHNRGAQR